MKTLKISASFSLCYRKWFSFQTPLVWFIEKWIHHIAKKGFADAIIIDICRAFDFTNYFLFDCETMTFLVSEKMLLIYFIATWKTESKEWG